MEHNFEISLEPALFALQFGVWRSPVAYTSGGRRVAGSNPVTPTN